MIIDLKQDIQEWLLFRHRHLGSSDVAAVLGVSPWKTAYELWEEKIQDAPPENKMNPAMRRGKELEPKARAQYELKYGYEVPAVCFEYDERPYLAASLDGWNKDRRLVVEIKYTGVGRWREIDSKKEVPHIYYPQVQHQMLVAGAEACHFVAYNNEIDRITVVEVRPDYTFIRAMTEKLERFWFSCVLNRKPPILSDQDYKTVQDKGLKALIEEWLYADSQRRKFDEDCKELKSQITELSSHPRMRYKNVRIQKITRRGAIDYKKIPQLEKVNLNDYRKEDTEFWQVTCMPDKKP